MSLIWQIAIIVFLFLLFALFHSVTASIKTKDYFARRMKQNFAFYRFGYNVISLILFFLIYEFSPHPDETVYDFSFPYDIIIFILQTISVIGIIWSVSVVELREFLGLSQIKRWRDGKFDFNEGDERLQLNLKGPFLFSRHPIYLFFILFLGLRPTMDVFYLTFYLCLVAYFIAGAFFEERKLIKRFGEKYVEYKSIVPMFIPYKKVNKEEIKRILETGTI